METLTSQLAGAAREAADRVAISYRQGDLVQEYTCGQLYRGSLAVAGWLKARGVARGSGWPSSWRIGPNGP